MNQGTQNATTTQQAPNWLLPYQQQGIQGANSAYQNPGTLVAPFSPQQEQAISNITTYANSGDPALNNATNFVNSTLGQGPQQNPMLNQLFTQGANQIQNQLSSQFAGVGRNADASAGAQGQAMGNFAANLYGNAFNTQAGLETAALGSVPSLVQSRLGLQDALYGAGSNVQNLAQQYIQAPQNNLDRYISRVQGVPASTTVQPYYTNTGANVAGGALLGSSLGGAIGGAFGGNGSNWGTGIGALAGGLLGLT